LGNLRKKKAEQGIQHEEQIIAAEDDAAAPDLKKAAEAIKSGLKAAEAAKKEVAKRDAVESTIHDLAVKNEDLSNVLHKFGWNNGAEGWEFGAWLQTDLRSLLEELGDEAAFVSVGGGAEPPGTVPSGSPRTDHQVSPTTGKSSPPHEKPQSPRVEPKPAFPKVEPGMSPVSKNVPAAKSSEKLPVELPGVLAESPQKTLAAKDSTSASIDTKLPVPPESPQKSRVVKPEPVAAGPPPGVTDAVKSIEKAKPEVALPVFELQPVSVLESEVQDVVDKYSARIHADFQKTFDCSWAKLTQEIEKCKMMGIVLEWFWIVGGTVTNAAEEADGLVVIKVQKGSLSKKGEVVHMSITGDDWSVKLPAIVDVVRKDFFKTSLSRRFTSRFGIR